MEVQIEVVFFFRFARKGRKPGVKTVKKRREKNERLKNEAKVPDIDTEEPVHHRTGNLRVVFDDLLAAVLRDMDNQPHIATFPCQTEFYLLTASHERQQHCP